MRGSLGATRKEVVLSDRADRQVVLVDRLEGPRVVRRIRASNDGPDLVDRASALGLVRQMPIRGFALVEDRAIVGGMLEVAESYVEGLVLGAHLEAISSEMSVSVAISLVHEIACGLTVLHGMTEPSGHPAGLIHGRIGVDQIRLTASGEPRVVGLDGLRGSPAEDLRQLLGVLQDLLSGKSATKAAGSLLERLAALEFDSARQLVAALGAYLERQSPQDFEARRQTFAARVARLIESDDDNFSAIMRRAPASNFAPEPSLGAAASIDIDDSDRPTVAVVARDVRERNEAETSLIESSPSARRGILQPAAPASPEPAGRASERSVTVGNYRVVASIGRGGMGEIYLARSASPHYKGLVALKVLGADDSTDDDALGMFMDEAAIMARIDHPNVLRVVDFGRAKGRHFLAMEYLEGRPLVRVMIDAFSKESGLDYGVIAALGADAAVGLHAAHVASTPEGMPLRIVHRDVSPQNIFVTYAGITKVIDFGVARAVERVSKTQVGVVKGKAAYMSPEQTEGKEVDARSDVFSLGVCLWEMIAGRRLFKRETEYDTLVAVASIPIERPTHVRGKPNAALDRIVLGALVRNRDKRTPSCAMLSEQLIAFAEKHGAPDRGAAIRELMGRLFGAAAAEERALIRQLEKRTATDEEESSLLRLSGVAHRKKSKEITLIGAPSGLNDLDRFGEGRSMERPRIPTVAGQIVLRAVEALKAEQAGTMPPREITRDPTFVESDEDQGSEQETIGVGAAAARDLEIVTSKPNAPWGRAGQDQEELTRDEGDEPSGERTVMPEIEEERSVVSEMIELSDEDVDGLRVHTDGGWGIITGELQQTTERARSHASLDALSEEGPVTEGRAGVPLSEGLVTEGRVGVPVSEGSSDTTSGNHGRPLGDRLLGAAIWGALAAIIVLVGLALSTIRPSPSPPPVVAAPDPVVKAPSSDSAPAPKPLPVHTSSSSLDAMLSELVARGFSISASEGTWLVTDVDGASAVIDSGAEVQAVAGPSFSGFIARTTRRGLPRALWVGATAGGRPRVKALTINDCPAVARVLDEGVRITYVGREVMLPHGGGGLSDVALDRPTFADRVVVEPLGLSFGKRDEKAGTAGYCTIGWWGRQVVLRGLPDGRYDLRWSGGDREERASLQVVRGEAIGGHLIRTSSAAR